MIDKREIELAIAAHNVWKTRLKQLIEAGERSEDVDSLRRDDLCTFGKWLNTLEDDDCVSPEYLAVRQLHADFHQAAAAVAEHAVAGDLTTASYMLFPDGAYSIASTKLVNALNAWHAKLP